MKLIRNSLFIYLLIIINQSFAQTNNIDSLVSEFNKENGSAKERLHHLKDIKWINYPNSLKEGLAILDQAIVVAEGVKDYLALAQFYEGKALFTERGGDLSLAEKYFLKSLFYAEIGKHHKIRLMMYIRLANLAKNQYKLEKEKEWLSKLQNDPEIVNHPSIQAMSVSAIGLMHYYAGKHRLAANHLLMAVNMQEKLKDLPNLAFEQENLGRAYRALGLYDSGYYWYNNALKLYQKTGSTAGEATIYYNIALAMLEDSRFDTAAIYMLYAKIRFEKIENIMGVGVTLEGLGLIFQSQKKYNTAIEHYLSAIEIFKKFSAINNLVETYGSLAEVYDVIGDTKKAIAYFTKSYQEAHTIEDPQYMAQMATRLSDVYLKIGNLPLTEINLKKAELAIVQIDNQEIYAAFYLCKAGLANAKNNNDACLLYLDSVFANSPFLQTSIKALELKVKAYKSLGNIQLAFEAQDRLIILRDSATDINNKNLEKEVLAKYQTDKVESELKIANLKNVQEKQLKYFGYSLFLLSMFFIFYILWRHKKYKKQKEETTRLKIEAVEKNISHAQEILQNQSMLILEKNRIIKEFKFAFKDSLNGEEVENQKNLDQFLETNILTKEDWLQFETKFSVLYPDFKVNIQNHFPQITSAEYRMLCLMKLGLSNEEMGDTLGVLPRSMSRTLNRFKAKFQIENLDLNNY